MLNITVSVSSPATGPTFCLAIKVLPRLGKTDGPDVFLIHKVVLRDENGEVVGDPLVVVVRVEPDGDHLGLLVLQQLILRLDIVLSTPDIELADLVPIVHSLSFIPEQ